MGLDYFFNCTTEPLSAHNVLCKAPLYPFNSPGVCALGELIYARCFQMLNLFILNFVPINSLKQKGPRCLFEKEEKGNCGRNLDRAERRGLP